MSASAGFPRRGEVYWVDFANARGGETGKTRPSIIVSNDVSNRYNNRVQVIPLTSKTTRVYPSDALVLVDGTISKALANQISTATKERLGGYIATLSVDDMRKVERAVVLQRDLTGAFANPFG